MLPNHAPLQRVPEGLRRRAALKDGSEIEN